MKNCNLNLQIDIKHLLRFIINFFRLECLTSYRLVKLLINDDSLISELITKSVSVSQQVEEKIINDIFVLC